MRVPAYAKINFLLRVLRRRDDGYHDLETLFQTISLHDTLTIERADAPSFTCDDPTIPTGADNLVVRAARAMIERAGARPVSIHLEKRIPAGGGLGGGSSDAAAVLRGIDRLCDLRTPDAVLHEIALSLGSDVPFFLVGGTAYATGRGERLVAFDDAPSLPLLLVLPEERVMTPEAFRLVAARRAAGEGAPVEVGAETVRSWIADGVLAHGEEFANDFEAPIFGALPRLGEYARRLRAAGAKWVRMSGSGSTIVGAFADAAARDAAAASFDDVLTAAAEPVPRTQALDRE